MKGKGAKLSKAKLLLSGDLSDAQKRMIRSTSSREIAATRGAMRRDRESDAARIRHNRDEQDILRESDERLKQQQKGGARKESRWIQHVKRYAKQHGVKYGEALRLARPSYKE